ncbi:MAG: D-2-hydroxyacid dehydrogenase [Gammaproteobacteria bacterium]|jgi:phosphoglycerate dehydrogenase-like enzyme|tara:strand:- start:284 stop:1255 length:972 start_codon:yes stop_codon:yes gene_type:complete
MKLVIAKDTDKYFGSQLRELDFPLEILAIDPEDSSNPSWDSIPECDAFFLSYQFLFAIRDNHELFKPLLNLTKRMKFIQTGYAGMDDPFCQAMLKESDAVIANASSIHAIPISHYVFSQMLRWNKRIDQHIELQQEKNWSPMGGDGELTNKTLLILGYGGIGKEVAKLGKAFGMNVIGIRRNPEVCEFADKVVTMDNLEEFLPVADFLVLALPNSEETNDVVDKNFLKKINNSAMLINVGRGNAVNEKDLAEALNSGILAAAALDTTKNEPLEKSSDLWSAKNCFISAHDSAHSLLGLPRAFELFLENVKNFKGNQPIKNLYR